MDDLLQTVRDRLRYDLLIASAARGVAVFVAFTVVQEPRPGIPHFFYVSIILAAFAGRPLNRWRCGDDRHRHVRGPRWARSQTASCAPYSLATRLRGSAMTPLQF